MAKVLSDTGPSTMRLIFIPSVVTLIFTLWRLFGELQHWSTVWFNPAAGGPLAVIGITWLVPIFGIYFARKLSRTGQAPAHAGRAVGYAVLGLLLVVGGGLLMINFPMEFRGRLLFGWVVMVVAAALQYPAWPALFRVLLAYGYAARIPVAIVMFFAMQGHWGTHYDAVPPDFPGPMSLWAKYFWLGFVPQLTFWVGFTVLVGSLFGSVATALLRIRRPTRSATSA